MQITDLLKRESVELNGSATDKKDALEKMVALMVKQGNIADPEEYKKRVFAREEEGSTGVGEGVAIPHAKTAAVTKPGLAFMRVKDGVEFDSLDGQPAKLFFLIAAPDTKDNVHLDVLSRLSTLLMDPDFIDGLMAVDSVDGLYDLIAKAEKEKFPDEETQEEAPAAEEAKPEGYQVLAVTACPTGIAHTYMAAESLEQHAAKRGISIKVETNGQSGVKNALTADDIANATGIIVAADKYVPMNRFKGKRVVIVKVADGINKADQLLDEALSGHAPVFEGEQGGAAAAGAEAAAAEESQARKAYKHLMNGVSHMLPFVIGGGILTAIAFLVDQPGLGTAAYGSSIPAAALFKTIGGEAFGLMLPILAGYIASSIADRPGLAPGFVGGLFAKAGYDFAYLGTLDAGALVSGGFIAALFAGFAAGYLTLGIEKLCDKLPSSLEGIKPMLIYPVLGTLAIGVVMLALNPVFAAINIALNGFLAGLGTSNIVVLGLVLGGMMSVDMGGPFNKAAYVFGTAALDPSSGLGATGQVIMASVMVGGMVPPLVIALSTTFFKNRWSKSDRNAGLVNYIMGLSFISEGAIPFAAADPGHVLPSCIIGSAIAGSLSAAFGCTSPAPHGGAWVTAVIGNPVMWLVACLVGSIVGCLILSLWKKPLKSE